MTTNVEVSAAVLERLLRQTAFARGGADGEYLFTCTELAVKGYRVTATATDGRQCARARGSAQYSEEDVDIRVLIPAAHVSLILEMLGAAGNMATLRVDKDRAEVRAEPGRVEWRQPEGEFPPCDSLFAG